MALTQAPAVIIPDMPRDNKIADNQGMITVSWQLGLSSLFQALQQNFSDQGIFFPRLSLDNINLIESSYAGYIGGALPVGVQDISGMTVFDTDTRVSKQFVITYDGSNNILTAAWRTFQYV